MIKSLRVTDVALNDVRDGPCEVRGLTAAAGQQRRAVVISSRQQPRVARHEDHSEQMSRKRQQLL